LPLYTTADAEAAIGLLSTCDPHDGFSAAPGIQVTFRDAGHILGASIVDVGVGERGRTTRLVFSGDLGRWGRPLVPDPELVPAADVVLVESTYGDRRHPADPDQKLAALVRDRGDRQRVALRPRSRSAGRRPLSAP
jgi:metallo-beta-lactamase family protein